MQVKPASPRLRRGRETSQLYAAWPLADRGSPTGEAVAGNGLVAVGSPAWTTGPDGPAISFPGTAGNYLRSAGPIFNPMAGDFSAALWVYTTTTAVQAFLSMSGGNGTTWLETGSGNALWCTLGSGSALRSTTVVTPNVWHHAALTLQGTTATIYLDGVQVAQGPVVVINNPNNYLNVGVASNGSTNPLSGMIGRAGVLLWQRALQPAEVSRLWADPSRLWTPRRRWAEFNGLAPAGGPDPAWTRRRRWFPGLARNR